MQLLKHLSWIFCCLHSGEAVLKLQLSVEILVMPQVCLHKNNIARDPSEQHIPGGSKVIEQSFFSHSSLWIVITTIARLQQPTLRCGPRQSWLLFYNRSFSGSENVARSGGSNHFPTFLTAWDKFAFHFFPAHSKLIFKMMGRKRERMRIVFVIHMSFISTVLPCCNLCPPSHLFSIDRFLTICNKVQ